MGSLIVYPGQKCSFHVFPKETKMLLFLILASGASADCGFKGSCHQDGLYPCPDDRSIFVQCGNGMKYEKDCAGNTYFNPSGPDTGICGYTCPWTTAPATTTTTTTTTTTEDVFTTPSHPIECWNMECDPPGYFPEKIFPCNKFYICQ